MPSAWGLYSTASTMLFLSFLLTTLQPPALPPSSSPNVPAASELAPSLDQAQSLYAEGSTLYEAADYRGAIDKFTAALALIPAGTANLTRQALLYNIARAHERAHAIDKDLTHLRQALTLYRRYAEYATKHGSQEEQLGVAERIRLLEESLRAHEEKPLPPKVTPEQPTELPVQDERWKRPRNLGIGLAVTGSAMLAGGIVAAVLGSRYEPNARSQVNKLEGLGVPMDHPAWTEGAEFIRQEQRKGRVFMGVGGALVSTGVILGSTGTYYIVKAKHVRVRVQPTTSYFGLSVQGKF